MKTDDWEVVAACKGRYGKPDFFSGFPRDIAACKKLCAKCQGRPGCLDFALRTNQEHGVWGGLTPDERAKVRTRK